MDVLVVYAAQAVDAARDATRTIPIVVPTVGDMLGGGYVASLARPGGNITGITLIATEHILSNSAYVTCHRAEEKASFESGRIRIDRTPLSRGNVISPPSHQPRTSAQ